MKTNESSIDRLLRIALGILLLAGGFGYLEGTWGLVLGTLGIIPLLTGLVGWCPLYRLFNISTCAHTTKAAQ